MKLELLRRVTAGQQFQTYTHRARSPRLESSRLARFWVQVPAADGFDLLDRGGPEAGVLLFCVLAACVASHAVGNEQKNITVTSKDSATVLITVAVS